MKYIQEAFDTNWVVPLGPNVNGFESDLQKFITPCNSNNKEVVALCSGTSAIHLALIDLGVTIGDEIFVKVLLSVPVQTL